MEIITKIEYKSEAPTIIYEFYGIEKYDKLREGYYPDLDFDTDYYKIIGDFYYCGLVIFGKLFLTEKQANDFVSKIKPTLSIIKDEAFYFSNLSDESLNTLRNIKLKAKHIGTVFENPDNISEDDEDEYLFLPINKFLKK